MLHQPKVGVTSLTSLANGRCMSKSLKLLWKLHPWCLHNLGPRMTEMTFSCPVAHAFYWDIPSLRRLKQSCNQYSTTPLFVHNQAFPYSPSIFVYPEISPHPFTISLALIWRQILETPTSLMHFLVSLSLLYPISVFGRSWTMHQICSKFPFRLLAVSVLFSLSESPL